MTEQQHVNITLGLLGAARSHYLWFHGAHHVTRGACFVGDHKLYAKIYEQYVSDYDALAEKAIVVLGEKIADPLTVTNAAAKMLASYQSPVALPPQGIANTGLQLERGFIARVERSRTDLQAGGQLSLGLDNLLSQIADNHETWVYQLGQRAK
jgi:hypothetical protein